MKILIAGVFLPERIELSYESSFKALGCEVRRFSSGEVNRLVKPFWENFINNKLCCVLKEWKPDLTLIMKGYYLWPKTIQKIRQLSKSLVFCFMADDPFNRDSEGATNENVIASIPYYDCYLIWTPSLIDSLLEAGARRVESLSFGFDARSHHPMQLSAAEKELYGSDIVFVGNWDEEREHWLEGLTDFDLGLWGENYWIRRCQNKELRKKWKGRPLYAEEMSKAFNAAKISLNIFRKQNKGNHNMRTFEAPACGAFVLTEKSPEVLGFFQEDKEAAYFSSPEELKEKCDYYLKHEEERRAIAQAGYRRCLESDYSYLDRARHILKVFDNISKMNVNSKLKTLNSKQTQNPKLKI